MHSLTNNKNLLLHPACIILLFIGGFLFGSWEKLLITISFDSWWHLSQGREIFRGNFWSETLTFTAFGGPNYAHSWAFDAIIYKVYELYSLGGLIAVNLFLGFVTFYLQILFSKRLGINTYIAIIIGLVSWYVSLKFFLLRPQLLTPVFLLSFFLLLFRFKGFGLFLFNYILFCLWSNFHGSFLIGLAIIIALAFASLLKTSNDLEIFNHPKINYIVLLITAILGVITHPQGFYALSSALSHDPFALGINRLINEWIPEPVNKAKLLYLLCITGFAITLVKRPVNKDSVLLAGLCLLPFMAARHIPIFCVLGVPILFSKLNFSLGKPVSSLPCLALLIGLMFGAGQTFNFQSTSTNELLNSIEHSQLANELPVKQAKYIKEKKIKENLFNLYEHGGFLGFIFDGTPQIFIDSRVRPFLEKAIWDYQDVVDNRETAIDILRSYNVSYVLLRSDHPFSKNSLLTCEKCDDDFSILKLEPAVP